MAPSTVADALAQVSSQLDPAGAFKTILSKIKSLSSPSTITTDLNSIADAIFSASLGVVMTRQVLGELLSTIQALDNSSNTIEVGQHVLSTIDSSSSLSASLVDAAVTARELVASAYEAQEDWASAARVLSEIPVDGSSRRVTPAERARIWIRIVRNYLEEDDGTAAELYLNKLKNVMPDVDDAELQLHFKLSAARIQDANRQFLAAAQSYHAISFTPSIAEEERLHTLSMAIKCAILAPAGPPRSRALGRLYKDERAAGLAEFGMLEKMFLDRLLAPDEVDKFSQNLAQHQLALTADGTTVLAKAVMEHNLLAASRLYTNIGFDDLGVLLGLDGEKAEYTTAKMIEQGRLTGRIDQIERIITFDSGEASVEKGAGPVEVAVGKALRRWDADVQTLAEHVEQLANALQAEFPDFVATQIAV